MGFRGSVLSPVRIIKSSAEEYLLKNEDRVLLGTGGKIPSATALAPWHLGA